MAEEAIAAEQDDQIETEQPQDGGDEGGEGEGGGGGGYTPLNPSTPRQPVVQSKEDRAKFEADLKSKLDKMFTSGDDSADDDEDDAEEEAEEQDQDDAEEGVENKGAAAEKQPAGKPVQAGNAPTLPAAYVRSLKSDGWTDEEIAEHAKLPNFAAVAAKIHDRRNAETARWADAGRQLRQQQQQQAAQQQQQPQNGGGTVTTGLKPIDTAKLREHYGDDKFIEEIEKVNSVIQQVNQILPAVQEVQRRSQVSETETLIRQIDGFFTGKELEPYKEIYGDGNSLASNKTQQEARNKVLEMADALIVGAQLQGRSLTLGDALTLAHDSLSSGYKVQAVRSSIQKELKQRNKAITQKPTGRANNPTGKNGSEKQLHSKIAGLLDKAFA